jgi:hypothetical protein
MSDAELISNINEELGIEIKHQIGENELREQLSAHINYMIQADFQKLINLLYRLDISETKLKTMLEENTDADSGLIIADLIIERQLQKIKSRAEHRRADHDIDEEEKW